MSGIGFYADLKGPTPSLALGRIVRRLLIGETAYDKSSPSGELRKKWDALANNSEQALAWPERQALEKAISDLGAFKSAAQLQLVGAAQSVIAEMYNRGYVPETVLPSVTGGIGIEYREPSKQAYFEIRPDEESGQTEVVLFMTDYKRSENDRIHYVSECGSLGNLLDLAIPLDA